MLLRIALFFLFITSAQAEKIGIYFGTFDPPHLGHTDVIVSARHAFELNRVLVYVNVEVLFKPDASSFEDRFNMATLAFAPIPRVELVTPPILRRDIVGRTYASYLEAYATLHPNDDVYVLYGSDAYETRFGGRIGEESARAPQARNLRIAVNSRDGSPIQRFEGVTVYDFPSLRRLSSTAVRSEVQAGSLDQSGVIAPVREYIRARGLYRSVNASECVVKILRR